jgi:D-arginine dehydrogenase
MTTQNKTCVIVGAGLAGAATAYYLTRLGWDRVVILEQELMVGVHSSGRNAAMIRQVVSDRAIALLAREGAAFLRQLPEDWPILTPLRQNGSFLLSAQEIHPPPGESHEGPSLQTAWLPIGDIINQVPILKGTPTKGGLWCASDGVIDIHGLLQGFLRSATMRGAELKLSSKLQSVVAKEGAVVSVQTQNEEIPCNVLVNAGGAWAGEIGQLAGAEPIPLTPYRRHIFVTEALNWVNPIWPIVWDITHEVYFRPESGGLLLSPCDETADRPGLPPTDESATEMLAEKVGRCFPEMPDLPIQNSWAGLRTMAPDRRFVIGWDPRVRGFFWVAGLGGHGVTVSPAVGRIAADLIIQEGLPAEHGSFSPTRFRS